MVENSERVVFVDFQVLRILQMSLFQWHGRW